MIKQSRNDLLRRGDVEGAAIQHDHYDEVRNVLNNTPVVLRGYVSQADGSRLLEKSIKNLRAVLGELTESQQSKIAAALLNVMLAWNQLTIQSFDEMVLPTLNAMIDLDKDYE
jgi:hypothetical protein